MANWRQAVYAPAGTVPVKFQWLWLSDTHVTQGSGTLRQAPQWNLLALLSPTRSVLRSLFTAGPTMT